MRKPSLVAVFLVTFVVLLLSPGAGAAPIELTVRVEGATHTLFEGPIRSDGHDIRAASDSRTRRCDGTNANANPVPGPTPTAAAADAMAIAGTDFDGGWNAGFDDYFIQRWGPDRENFDSFAFWGVLVDGAFTSVGGCQFRDQPGDEVLWAYDAFNSRPFLRLAAVADPTVAPAPPHPTAFVGIGEPLGLKVESYTGAMDGAPQDVQPAAAVSVAPVTTDMATGFETTGPATVTTAGDGTASATFATPGWHRLKAVSDGSYVRSNRLDVCVRPSPAVDCGPLPFDAQVRVPPAPSAAPQMPAPSPIGPPNAGSAGEFTVGRARANKRTGTATVTVHLPGAGRLGLYGKKVQVRSMEIDGASTRKVSVEAVGRARSMLHRKGLLEVTVTVSFTSAAGVESAIGRKVALRFAPGLK